MSSYPIYCVNSNNMVLMAPFENIRSKGEWSMPSWLTSFQLFISFPPYNSCQSIAYLELALPIAATHSIFHL